MSGDKDGDGNPFNNSLEMAANVVHELGHAYNFKVANENNRVALSSSLSIDLVGLRDKFLRPNPYNENLWQQNAGPYPDKDTATSETVADMFLAWVYDSWNQNQVNKNSVDQATAWAQTHFP